MTASKKTFVVNHDKYLLTLTSFLIRTFPSYVYLLVLRVCVFCFSSLFFWIRKNQNKLTNSTAVHNITACLSPVGTDNS